MIIPVNQHDRITEREKRDDVYRLSIYIQLISIIRIAVVIFAVGFAFFDAI